MDPSKSPGDVVELVDVLLRDGAVLAADVVVTVADVPLIGIQLRLALAGMTEMRDRGIFEEWDEALREQRGGASKG